MACKSTKQMENEESNFEFLTTDDYKGAKFRFYEIVTEPKEFKMLLNDKQLKSKLNEYDIKTNNFVILNLGQRNSGGYGIKINKVEITSDKALVYVQETVPDPMSNVTYALTFPVYIAKIKSKKPIEFIEVDTAD